jgi:hypothetical protein
VYPYTEPGSGRIGLIEGLSAATNLTGNAIRITKIKIAAIVRLTPKSPRPTGLVMRFYQYMDYLRIKRTQFIADNAMLKYG